MVRGGCVYILCNKNNTTVYTGVTSDLPTRLLEHQSNYYPNSFTAKYKLKKLVYFESFGSIEEAIEREKFIKGKKRSWKNQLVTSFNPNWRDLTEEVMAW